ncbi:GLE1-domain-containing protein [Wallemia mellicola CBS 633.66]|uniref:mRNA export factor GLE1 n=2 Tax=Wallemia mellicola TaxID=1708541 RepID=A0A4V4N2S4_9BASI|nr:GLE1-domain-containing protein [Wallemia mellicola CBS 633.66]TIB67928.1 hypothetical protein E3Q24_03906 [Wallemia mellicola]EIM20506.1 GLE1-domain-containing protein [Wallemia mellicola CBS 633.66]TIB79872.1 GLE1-domain-containing protein [Wallemia mellicola]TIB83856.1 GLE1-domain-containing protein [Wallemia mellicola]TIB90085.1 GLE1-domain-containing protein [Wallemia mellicola]|eukprot:XP_006959532.1 GLE1-domain-containing protein [Wallemia mellicola CBS 633.66]
MKYKVPEISRNGYGILDFSSDEEDIDNPVRLKSILKSSSRPTTKTSASEKRYIDGDYGKLDELEYFQDNFRDSVDYNVLNSSFTRSTSVQLDSVDDELEAIQKTISNMQLQSKAETEKLAQDFEKRNKSLWNDIELSISNAQKEADREYQEQQRAEEIRIRIEQEKDEKRKQEVKKQEEELKQQKQQRSRQLELEKAEADKQKFGLISAKNDYDHWYNLILNIKRSVLPQVAENPAIKKACSASKRKITPKIGQLTNSISQTSRITNEVNDVLNEPKRLHGEQSPAYLWLLNHLSKCLIRQAEAEVSAKITTAFPLARLVVSLVVGDHPQLADVLMGRLVKKACWIVPFYPRKSEGETDEAYNKRVGRKNSEETTVQYNDRMGGIAAFYFAILQTRLTANNLVLTTPAQDADLINRLPVHFRFSQSWTWLSHALRPPLPTLSTIPQLLATFFEILGEPYKQAYGKQAVKVLQLIKSKIGDESSWAKNSEANITRIKLLLDKWQTGQSLSSTDGRLWEN